MNSHRWIGALLCAALLESATGAADPEQTAAPNAEPPSAGAILYAERCASCHDHPQDRLPSRAELGKREPEQVALALTGGLMRSQSIGLNLTEINSLAQFLTGRMPGPELAPPPEQNVCQQARPARAAGSADWNGWGRDAHNTRYQPEPGLAVSDLARLAPRWAFGLRGATVYGQPTVAGGRLYVTSSAGRIYSLDAASGCSHWTFDAGVATRTAISIATPPGGKLSVYFGDDSATVHALDAATGQELWRQPLDAHPMARITGAPAYHAGRLYVPVSSIEELAASSPNYECCTFRGRVAALDAATGRVLWNTPVIAAAPKPLRRSANGVQLHGPAGGAVWNSPTIDARRGVLYVGTGNSYTDAAAPTFNAVLALDLANGRLRWARQLTADDNWVIGCAAPPRSPCPPGTTCKGAGMDNCPRAIGPDVDFGTSAILRTLTGGRRVLLIGQKSGRVYGLDPDRRGAELWVTQAGPGGIFGGIEWGLAADADTVYAPIGNVYAADGRDPGGLTAIDIVSGRVRWSASPIRVTCSFGAKACTGAQTQAATVIPGAVFSGAEDGHLRAYATDSGQVIWDFDTAREFASVNGVTAIGGSLDHGGAVLVDGALYVLSGYGRINGQPGNLLLALSVDGK